MIQLHMYLREITNFLRTLTIKDTLIADQMLKVWVNEEYQQIVSKTISAHPYYKQLRGEYIVFDHDEIRPIMEKLYDDGYIKSDDSKEDTIDYLLNKIFPLTTTLEWMDPDTNILIQRDVPNVQLYRYCNKVPVVYSYDTKTQIPYTKEFLHKNSLGIRVHANTTAIYKIPKSRYIKLLSRYPKESAIINAVTYPIKKSIDLEKAEDFSILSCDESMLESSEYQSIIDCVADTLAMIKRRYAVEGFNYENLYAPAHYYLIWQILYLAIFVRRIMNIKTGQAHSYHIWRYLKSNGFEDYRDILSITQQKFLYKNLPYLNQHKGTQHALEILTYVFLTLRNMTLQAKNVIQSVSTDNEGETTVETTKKYPTVKSIRVADSVIKDINTLKNNSKTKTGFEDILHYLGVNAGDASLTDLQEYMGGVTEDIYELYDKERKAKLEYQDDYNFSKSTNSHTAMLSYTNTSHLNTKLLEIKDSNSVKDYETIYTKFVAETLLYLAYNGQLEFQVEVQLANSSRLISLTAREWVGMIFYALYKIYNDKCEYPPAFAFIEWPFKLEHNEIPETFYWNKKEYKSKNHLNKVVLSYSAFIEYSEEYRFNLVNLDQVSDPTKYVWITDNGEYQLSYNLYFNWWNILDKDQKIVYHTKRMKAYSSNILGFTWYDIDGNRINSTFAITNSSDNIYMADVLLNPYKDCDTFDDLFSEETFSEQIHKQAMNFLTAYVCANADESAIHRALYDKLIDTFCYYHKGTGPTRINLEGKLLTDVNGNHVSFKDYLRQDYNNDIVVLNGVLELYDTSSDASTLYSRMIDKIIETLLPDHDGMLSLGVLTLNERYKRVIEMFKSITSYNLAYLDPEFSDMVDTKMSVHVSDYTRVFMKRNITELFDLQSISHQKIKQVFKPTYIDQDDVINCTFTLSENQEEDTLYKQELINRISKVLDIIDSKKGNSTSKKKKLMKLFNDNEELAKSIMKLPLESLKAIKYTKDRIYRHNVDVKIKIKEHFDADPFETTYSVNTSAPYKCTICGTTLTNIDQQDNITEN